MLQNMNYLLQWNNWKYTILDRVVLFFIIILMVQIKSVYGLSSNIFNLKLIFRKKSP